MTKAKIPYNKVCNYCRKEFIAYKRTTKYCSHDCSRRAYKQAKREETYEHFEDETLLKHSVLKATLLLEEIAREVKKVNQQLIVSSKPYLTPNETCHLLSMSRKSFDRLKASGKLPTYTIGKGRIYVKRSDIDKLFQSPNKLSK